jgi:hypothetical protein
MRTSVTYLVKEIWSHHLFALASFLHFASAQLCSISLCTSFDCSAPDLFVADLSLSFRSCFSLACRSLVPPSHLLLAHKWRLSAGFLGFDCFWARQSSVKQYLRSQTWDLKECKCFGLSFVKMWSHSFWIVYFRSKRKRLAQTLPVRFFTWSTKLELDSWPDYCETFHWNLESSWRCKSPVWWRSGVFV